MKIEILYPELCNLYGDKANGMYLKSILKDATFIETHINDKPIFISKKIDLVYIGSSTEKNQELIIKQLQKYQKEILEKINNNQIIIATGNALEIFCNHIENEDGSKIKCLGIFNAYAIRDRNHRHNSLFLGKFNDIDIVGYKSQFSHLYGLKNSKFIDVIKGVGANPTLNYEGINKNNFFGTYLLGPFLILNPYFTKYLLKKMNYNKKLEFEDETIDAYKYRLEELLNDKTSFGSMHN